eukprot:COSAG01_NODE_575_length_15274_cov_83.942603_2_plen_334_part_00
MGEFQGRTAAFRQGQGGRGADGWAGGGEGASSAAAARTITAEAGQDRVGDPCAVHGAHGHRVDADEVLVWDARHVLGEEVVGDGGARHVDVDGLRNPAEAAAASDGCELEGDDRRVRVGHRHELAHPRVSLEHVDQDVCRLVEPRHSLGAHGPEEVAITPDVSRHQQHGVDVRVFCVDTQAYRAEGNDVGPRVGRVGRQVQRLAEPHHPLAHHLPQLLQSLLPALGALAGLDAPMALQEGLQGQRAPVIVRGGRVLAHGVAVHRHRHRAKRLPAAPERHLARRTKTHGGPLSCVCRHTGGRRRRPRTSERGQAVGRPNRVELQQPPSSPVVAS